MSALQDLAGRIVDHGHDQESLAGALGIWHGSASGLRVRSVFEGGVWVLELDTGTAPLEVHDLPGVDGGDLLAVSLAELELLHEGRPRLARLAPTDGGTAAVFVDHPTSSWAAWMPCANCGGYRIPLPVCAHRQIEEPRSTEARIGLELAREATLLLMQRFGGSSCPGCSTDRIRSGEVDLAAESAPMVWLDTLGPRPGWQLWLPLEGVETGVAVPLDLPAWCAPEEVDEAARMLIASEGALGGRREPLVYDWEEGEDGLGV